MAVAETGSFSAAAKRLRVTQPAITLAVASLERAFGVKLYIRKKYTIELTAEGKIVADSAKKISQEVAKMERQLTVDRQGQVYQIGLIDSIAHLLYSSTDTRVLSNVEVMVDNSRRIIADLLAGRIDVGLVTGQLTPPNKELMVHKLHNEEFVFVCAPYLAPAGAVTHIDDWLAVNQDSTSYRHFLRLFKKEGLHVTPVFYSTSMDLLKEMAVAGKGTALLPKHVVKESLQNGTLELVATKPLYRPIWAITKKAAAEDTTLNKLSHQVDELLVRGNGY